MIDSASIVAIADQVKETLDKGKALVDAWTVLAVSFVAVISFIIGKVTGKKDSPAKDDK